MSTLPRPPQTRSTLADLARVSDKAELIGGTIVLMSPTGFRPSRVAAQIFMSLDQHAKTHGQGVALTDNVGFAVPELSSGRESFSPDASFYTGPLPRDDMDFIEGPPTLAVEVRGKEDYGDAAEKARAAKRADYFEAGTPVVWDVDSKAKVVRVYRDSDPNHLIVFSTGQVADAEPAVPGWRLEVDRMFA
jgi:Uma2 family endonuclease